MFDLVVTGGTVITETGARPDDVGIDAERIGAVGPGLQGRRVLDARGMLVLPGAVDPHVHLAMPAGQVTSSDDWFTGTRAAACGGTTTVIDFVEPEQDRDAAGGLGTLTGALATRRAEAEAQAVVDFGLHVTLRPAPGRAEPDPATLAEIPAIVEAGCPSFKTYLTYGGFYLSDAGFLAALAAVGAAGGLALVHAENDAGIAYLQCRFRAAGQAAPVYHALSRPAALEAEAIGRSLALAAVADCPLYVVHVSTAAGACRVAEARSRGQAAYGETCPQYLLLNEDDYRRPGFEGAKYVCSPPLRSRADQASLWQALAARSLDSVATDHCPFFYAGQKESGRADFTAIPGGLPGIEGRLSLLYTYGVGTGRLTLPQWVHACSTAAARIFGLYPRKGTLCPGADADLVIFDPERPVTLARRILHENTDYTPYEGFRLRGYPDTVLARGRVIYAGGQFLGQPGSGRFLARGPIVT